MAQRSRFWLPWLACLLLSIAAAFTYELWTLAREPRWAELHLDAAQTPDGLELTWDREAPVIRDATNAQLAIADGPKHWRTRLTEAQIRAGKFTYRATHGDVLFRLEVYGSGVQASGDTLRYVGVSQPAIAAEVQPPAPAAPVHAKTQLVAEERTEIPPSVLHEVEPVIPEGIRARIEDRIVVPVEVQVDRAGRVTASNTESEGDGLYRYLAEQAKTAARLWRFTPAKAKNGNPVPGRKTIYFTFTAS
ncbi:MAG: hypothetical protein C5B51_29660 [Terriglobia bacterium]|nr:MAG: hypothetical protein C5B51_29660 [Terriglobia bacterium]